MEAKDAVTPRSSLHDDLGMDEVDLIEVMFRAEERFGLVLPDNGIGLSSTVSDIVDLIAARLREQEAPLRLPQVINAARENAPEVGQADVEPAFSYNVTCNSGAGEMGNLTTTFMGLTLSSPLVASASPLCDSAESISRLEEVGIAGVVLPSLFEEQLMFKGRGDDDAGGKRIVHTSRPDSCPIYRTLFWGRTAILN